MEQNELFAALAKAQGMLSAPPKNREVEVFSRRTQSKYKFKYATLDAIIDHVRKPLTENGLWFVQTLQNGDGRYKLITRLTHSSGQYIESETPLLVDAADNQAFGSALSYMRRYALSAILGVAADDDDDANHADGNTVESSKERKPGATVRSAARSAAPGDKPENQPMNLGAKPTTPPLWNGPLTPEDLQAKLRQFLDDLGACTDDSELSGVLAGYDKVLAQCKSDLPKWWNGSDEKPGVFARIEAARKRVNTLLGAA